MSARRLRILTWHVHGNYLWYLTRAPHEFLVVTTPGSPSPRPGLGGSLPWGPHCHEVRDTEVARQHFDLVLYQSRTAWETDRHTLLAPAQRALPQIVLEHDPPRAHPTDTRHWAADGADVLVHVTPFNALMWDNGGAATRVIEHGVLVPDTVRYSGTLARGVVVVNHLARRGRRLGADLYAQAAAVLPLDLVGMGAGECGGLGEIANPDLPAFMARYRLFYHPVRYTSLGLALLEAMHIGMPVVALATTEVVRVIDNGRNGYADTRPAELIEVMRTLLADPDLARRWGDAARETVLARYSIGRFVADWNALFAALAGSAPSACR